VPAPSDDPRLHCEAPDCDEAIVIDTSMSLQANSKEAGWTTIIAGDEIHFTCCDEHGMLWVEKNKHRFMPEWIGE